MSQRQREASGKELFTGRDTGLRIALLSIMRARRCTSGFQRIQQTIRRLSQCICTYGIIIALSATYRANKQMTWGEGENDARAKAKAKATRKHEAQCQKAPFIGTSRITGGFRRNQRRCGGPQVSDLHHCLFMIMVTTPPGHRKGMIKPTR